MVGIPKQLIISFLFNSLIHALFMSWFISLNSYLIQMGVQNSIFKCCGSGSVSFYTPESKLNGFATMQYSINFQPYVHSINFILEQESVPEPQHLLETHPPPEH